MPSGEVRRHRTQNDGAYFAGPDTHTGRARRYAAGRVIPQDPDALLSQSEFSYLTPQSELALEAYRLKGGGPPFIVVGKRSVRYRRGDVLDLIAVRRRRSPSDPGPAHGAGK